MPLYAMLSTLTDEGWKTIKNNPGRIQEVNQEVEGMGVRLISQYAALGAYDFISIVEAPDNLSAANMAVQLGSRGTVQIRTIPLLDVEAFIGKIKTE